MSKPAQMFDHELNGVKGFYPGMPWVVDKAIDLDGTVDETTVKAGMVAHQDPTSKKFKLGIGTVSTTSHPIPVILFQNGTDFDVVGDDGNIIGAAEGGQSPRLSGLVVNQGAEVESTEYDSAVYAPGDLLTAGSDGKIEKYSGTGASTILGVVSDGVRDSEHSNAIKLLRFHTVYVIAWS